MNKIFQFLLFIFSIFIFSFSVPKDAHAAICSNVTSKIENGKVIISVNDPKIIANEEYQVRLCSSFTEKIGRTDLNKIKPVSSLLTIQIDRDQVSVNGSTTNITNSYQKNYCLGRYFNPIGGWIKLPYKIHNAILASNGQEICGFEYEYKPTTTCTIKRTNDPADKIYQPGGSVTVDATFTNFPNRKIVLVRRDPTGKPYLGTILPSGDREGYICTTTDGSGHVSKQLPIPVNAIAGVWTIETYIATSQRCDTADVQALCPVLPFGVKVASPDVNTQIYTNKEICSILPPGSKEENACTECFKQQEGVWTALGCLPKDINGIIKWLLEKAIYLGGGIAFLFMIMGSFQIIFSGGDPEKLNGGKEVLTSAVAGLLMIIFSVVLLKIIGYDILRIPGINIF